MSTIGPVTQQGVISTQVEQTQRAVTPAVVQAQQPVETPPPPPPAESGRGMEIDTSA